MSESSRLTRLELIERVPLFSCLGRDELRSVEEAFVEVSYRKGATICREGDDGDSFFAILSGEIEVRTAAAGIEPINRLGPGDYMGEMALLMGGKRTATLSAARSTRLLALDRATFQSHFLHNAKVLEHFVRVLTQRLANREREGAGSKPTLAISVVAEAGMRGKSLTGSALAGILRDISGAEVVLLCGVSAEERLGPPHVSAVAAQPADRLRDLLKRGSREPTRIEVTVDPDSSAEALAESLGLLIAKLSDEAAFVVIDVASRNPHHAAAAEEVADVVVEIVGEYDPSTTATDAPYTRRYRVLNLYNGVSRPVPINSCEPFVLPVDAALRESMHASTLAYVRENRHVPVSTSLHRLARKILGRTIGIAVGGGAAFGIAHVGVFRVLERNGIEVDLLSGTSMGSIIALGYAAGIRATEMYEIARRIGNVTTTLSALDFNVTRPGLLAGRRLISIFGPLLGSVQAFDELALPCQVVATDIRSGEAVNIGSGRLDSAFRASSSVPMLWSPVPRGERVLVDGGVLDPVPARLVREMGADICIAVNVVPPVRQGVETVISRLYRQASWLNPASYLGEAKELPNTFDVIMNSIQLLQHELGNFKSISADVRIVPDLSAFTWIEFYRAMELIERGEEATEQALPEIRRVLDERPVRPRLA